MKLTGPSADGTSWGRTGQSRRRRFSTGKQPSEQLPTSLSVKVYLRNSGKGILEYSNDFLRFYIESGRFAKKKELAKQIPLNEVENISLEEKELIVEWKDSTQRFVFENTNQAKTMFESAHDFYDKSKTQNVETPKVPEPSEQPPQISVPEAEPPQEPKPTSQTLENKPRSKRRPQLHEKTHVKVPKPPAQTTEAITMEPEIPMPRPEVSTPEAEAPVKPEVPVPPEVSAPEKEPPKKEIITPPPAPPKEEQDATSALVKVYPIVDLLFDILRNLHGKVDWSSIENNVEKINDQTRRIEKTLAFAKLDVSLLAEATKQGNTDDASKEAYKILISLNAAFSGLPSTNTDSPQIGQQYETAKAILHSYYILNDLLLAFVVGDPTTEEETAQLTATLNGSVKPTNLQLDTKAIIAGLSKVQAETESQQSVEECRTLFKKQVESLLHTVKSPQ